jgi:hypothetical protein
MYEDKFDEVVKALKEAYEDGSLNEIIDTVFDMVMNDVFKDYPTNRLGTFAEFKHIDKVISKSSYRWATCDIQEAIRKAKEEQNV